MSSKHQMQHQLQPVNSHENLIVFPKLYLIFHFTGNNIAKPDFPLIPASKGFCLTLVTFLENFKRKLNEIKPCVN